MKARVPGDAAGSLLALNDGPPRPARNDQWGATEKEFVDLVAGAILGQLFEVEHLAHVETHGGDDHPMPGLVDILGLVGPHLHAPGVGTHPRHLPVIEPVATLELETR